VGLGTAGAPCVSAAQTPSLVAIVHESNPVPSLTIGDLARIFKLSRTRWEHGAPIDPYLPPRQSEESEALWSRILQLPSEVAVSRYYLRLIFQQRITAAPPRCVSAEDAVSLVSGDPGGIAIVHSEKAQGITTVRILHVDGL
jgi:hypothetical protein